MPASIHAFGTYLPRYRIKAETIARQWRRGMDQARALGIVEKTVNAADEDTFTMAWEAARKALDLSTVAAGEVSAVFVGSESHPYAVKPTSGMLVHALGLNPYCHAADLEFACKAGTAAMQIVASMVEAQHISYGLAVGSDTAQSRPGDPLEYSAAAGAAAFLIGRSTTEAPGICTIDGTLSYTTDTPDFWRNEGEAHPKHAGRFTGEPAYFHHTEAVTNGLLSRMRVSREDIDHVVFHMPNAKFPKQAARALGFTETQIACGFVVPSIGNTYSACSLLGLASVLQQAKQDERILLVSYGSGAGADAFLLTMQADGVPLPRQENEETTELRYTEYLHLKQADIA